MQDNIRVYFNDKAKFESIIKKRGGFNCTIQSDDLKNEDENISLYPIKGKIGTLTYVISKHFAFVENSIHKFYNYNTLGEEINYNDFSYCDITKALDELRSQLPEYDFLDTKISNLEFGFNLKLDHSAKEIIEKNILLYKNKTHYVFEDKKGFVLKKFKSGNHLFKIYDKGRQNGLDYELLRIELKYTSKELQARKFGINTVCDLYDPYKNYLLFKDFESKFEQLLIVDDRFNKNLTKEEISNLGNKLEYTYWLRGFNSHSTKSRHKKALQEFIKNKKLNTVAEYLKNKISEKFSQLFKDCEGALPINI